MTDLPGPLASSVLVVPAHELVGGSGESIERAHLDARAAARTALAWAMTAEGTVVTAALELPKAATIRSTIRRAAATGHPGVRACAPSGSDQIRGGVADFEVVRPWTLGPVSLGVPDPWSLMEAERTRGVVLENAERWDDRLADLADHLSLALDAHVRISLAVGHVEGPSLGDGYWATPVVAAIGGPVTIEATAGNLELSEGQVSRVDGLVTVVAGEGAVALVAGIREPRVGDLWGSLADVAGYWPRLRIDLTTDPATRAVIYGLESEEAPIRVVIDELQETLLTVESGARCLAAWRANILPASRPALGGVRTGCQLVGSLPGGVGFVPLAESDGLLRAAAGGWTFPIHVDALGLLPGLMAGERHHLEGLSGAEYGLANLLLDLGLARLVDG